MNKILVIHGPNLGLLGSRQPEIYGHFTLDEINGRLRERANDLGVELEDFQSDHEGQIVEKIGQTDAQFIVINPAAYTHTSVAIADALAARDIPAIEVHLSNIYKREEFRHKSMVSPYVLGQITGLGEDSYVLALEAAVRILKRKTS
ncbi:type II 3-dehydroquinate dehydratase [PVC group bacterium]|nr:type II 3-dehydroquinate dehydratase [PVC group bacterium]